MENPAKSTILPPSDRCRSCRAVFLSGRSLAGVVDDDDDEVEVEEEEEKEEEDGKVFRWRRRSRLRFILLE